MPLAQPGAAPGRRVHDEADRAGEARDLRRDVVRPAGQPRCAGARGRTKASGPPPAFRRRHGRLSPAFGAGEITEIRPDGNDMNISVRFRGRLGRACSSPASSRTSWRRNKPSERQAQHAVLRPSRESSGDLNDRIASQSTDNRFAHTATYTVPGLWHDPHGSVEARPVVPRAVLPRPAASHPRRARGGARRGDRRSGRLGQVTPWPITSSCARARRGTTTATAVSGSSRTGTVGAKPARFSRPSRSAVHPLARLQHRPSAAGHGDRPGRPQGQPRQPVCHPRSLQRLTRT